MDTTAIRLIMRNAIPFPLNSGEKFGMRSNILNSVLEARQAKTQNSPAVSNRPAPAAMLFCSDARYAIKSETAPEVPPEMSAVLALLPISISEAIPHSIRKTP